MPEHSSSAIYASLERGVHGFRSVRNAGDRAFGSNVLRSRDLDHLYESTFLNVAAAFEAYEEELFFASILGRSGIARVVPMFPVRSRAEAERLVQATERMPFMNWLRQKDVGERSRRFLVGGRPFSRLERHDADLDVLRTVAVVRNAIAHKSGHALTEFMKLPMQGLGGGQKRPGKYLRQTVRSASQHENMCVEILRIAKALSEANEHRAKSYLRPERAYQSGDMVQGGSFECVVCRAALCLTRRTQPLPQCPQCGPTPCVTCGHCRKAKFSRLR